MKNLIDPALNQYKANLHCHSVYSDGKLTPEQLKDAYKSHGYSVLCISDHEHLIPHNDLTDEDFLTLTGYEVYIRKLPHDNLHNDQIHFNLFARDKNEDRLVYFTPEITKYIPKEQFPDVKYFKFVEHRRYEADFINEMVDYAKKCGFIAQYNHPVWSFENESDILSYEGFFAMEWCNYGCVVEGFNEFNEVYYETNLRAGRNWAPTGGDDNHNRHPFGDPHCDSFGAFTYILADKLDYDTVFSALENQNFYASTGPRIYSLVSDKGTLRVKTSNARKIVFSTDTRHRKTEIAVEGKTVNEAEFVFGNQTSWVRVEVVDEKGNKAVSRAYYKDEVID